MDGQTDNQTTDKKVSHKLDWYSTSRANYFHVNSLINIFTKIFPSKNNYVYSTCFKFETKMITLTSKFSDFGLNRSKQLGPSWS